MKYIELWQKEGMFDEFKLTVRIPDDDSLTDDKQRLNNAFNRCNIPDKVTYRKDIEKDSNSDEDWSDWRHNEGLVIIRDSHTCSVGDLLVMQDKESENKSVYCVDNIGFTKLN